MLRSFAPIRRFLLICVVSIAAAFSIANAKGYAEAGNSLPHILELQQGLSELGYDPGVADGVMGSKTSEVIRAFQRDHKLIEDGNYSALLLIHVKKQVAIAREEATPEGQKRKEEKEILLSMSDEDLIRIIENSERQEAARIVGLVGERALDFPMRVIFSAIAQESASDEDVKKLTAFLSEISTMVVLRMLLYQFTDTDDGIRQFQRDLGDKETGELTMRQWLEMNKRMARQYETPVYLTTFDKIRIYSADGYASAKGTWVLEGEQIAWPIQTSEITCRRDTRECTEIIAYLDVPKVADGTAHYVLMLDSNSWSIVSWDSSEIIARDSGNCRTTVLTLSLQSNEVYQISRNNDGNDCRQDPLRSPALEKPRMARLVPGFELSRKFWEERKKSYDFISRTTIKMLTEKASKFGKELGVEIPGF